MARMLPLGGFALFVGFLAMVCLPHRAMAEWSAIADAKVLYTDNISELSASRRLALAEDPSQPTRISIDNPSDVVWQPSIDLRHTSRPTNLGATEVSVKAAGFIATENPLFNHGNYRIQVKQALDRDTSILLRYRYVPNLFLGPNFERRTGLRHLEEERVTSHVWHAELERRLNDSLTAALVGRYGLRNYNEFFAERDTTFGTLGPQLEWKLTSTLSVTTAYLYERGLADGREQIQFRDDVSYRQHFVSIGVTMQFMPQLSCTLGYAYRRKEFTSEFVGDANRGVVDQTHQGGIDLLYQLTPAAALTAGFQRTQRSSSAGIRDFFNTNTSLGVQYRF